MTGAASQARPTRPVVLALALVVVGAVAVRLVVIAQLSGGPLFGAPVCDELDYHQHALALLGRTPPAPPRAYWHEPLYPTLLAGVYAVVGASPARAILLNPLLDGLACLLTFFVGRRLFGPRVALGAAAALAVYGTGVFHATQLLATSLTTVLVLLALLLLLRLRELPSLARAAALGAALGLAALAKGTALALGAAVIAYVALRLGRRGWLLGAVVAAVGLAVIAPVTVRNYRASGELVLISSNAGINLWIGNNPDFDRTVAIRPGPAWGELVREPLRAGVRGPARESRYFVAKTLAFARRQPGTAAWLLLRKARQLVWGVELPRNQRLYPARAYSPLLAALLWKHGIAFPAGVALPLGLVGLGLAVARRRPGAGAALLVAAAWGAAVVAVFVTARYRMPLVPILLLGAAFAVAEVIAAARRGAWRLVALLVAAAATTGVVANWRVGPMADRFDADTYFAAGRYFHDAGRRERAAALFALAIAADPTYPYGWSGTATVHWERGERDAARAAFERALALNRDPDMLEAAARFFAATGDPARAAALRAEAARATPAR